MSAVKPYLPAAPSRAPAWLALAMGAAMAVLGTLFFAHLGAGHLLLAVALGVVAALGVVYLGARAMGFGGAVVALMVGCALLVPNRVTMPLTPKVWGEAWDFSILLSGFWLLLLAMGLLMGGHRLRATGMEKWFAALFAVALLSLLVNINRYGDLDPAARGMVRLFAPMVTLPLVASVPMSRRQRGLLLTCLIILAVVVFGMGLFTTFRWWWTRLGPIGSLVFSPIQSALGRTRSPLGGPHVMALVLAMIAPVALVRMLGARSLGRQVLYGAIALFLLAGVVFSLSRSAVAVALLGMLFFGAINRRALERRALLTVTLFVVAALVIVGVVDAYRNRLNFGRLIWVVTRQGQVLRSDRLRSSSVEAALRITERHPLIGSGIGRWYPRDRSITPVKIYGAVSAREPHSLFLITLSEMGGIGLLLIAVIVVKPVRDFLRAHHAARDLESRALLSALATGALMVALYGVTASGVMVGYRMAYFLWAFLGLGYQLVFETQEETRAP